MKIEVKIEHLHELSSFIATVDKHRTALCIVVFGVPAMVLLLAFAAHFAFGLTLPH